MAKLKRALIKIASKWRVLLVIAFLAAVLCALILMLRPNSVSVNNGICGFVGR